MSATHNFNSAALMAAVTTGVHKGLKVSMIELQNDLRKRLSKAGTGRTYWKSKSSTYVASALGFAPVVKYGNLRRSVRTKPVTSTDGAVDSIKLAGIMPYAKYLEYGMGRWLGRRPFIRPAVAQARKEVRKILNYYIQAEMKKMRSRMGK